MSAENDLALLLAIWLGTAALCGLALFGFLCLLGRRLRREINDRPTNTTTKREP
jgi:hypothetical protein